MKTKAFFNKILWTCVTLLLSLFCVFQSVHTKTANAEETTVAYTDVMTDLTKSGTFNVTDYPSDESDYTFKLIQVAESSDDELFLYVYQPSHATKDLIATSVNLSATADDTLDNHIYHLTLVSTHGVFDKYVVEGLEIPSSTVRIYNITSLYRDFDKDIDSPTGTDNTISEIACNIGKKWTAVSAGDDVIYVEETIETIEVTGQYAGFVRYYDDSLFGGDDYDSFYVGFKTDKKIEDLLSARVYAKVSKKTSKWDIYFGVYAGQGSSYSEPEEKYFDVVRGEEDSFKTSGLVFNETYVWDQIQTLDEFYSESKASYNMTKEEAKNHMDWVLRFFNAPCEEKESTFMGFGEKKQTSYVVKDVSILQLTYKENGVVHVAGVVDNMTTGSEKPSVEVGQDFDWLAEVLGWILGIGLLALLVVVLLNFCPWIIALIGKGIAVAFKWIVTAFLWLLKWIWRIICAPFKLIGKLFKRE